jgi:hypothetical protein
VSLSLLARKKVTKTFYLEECARRSLFTARWSDFPGTGFQDEKWHTPVLHRRLGIRASPLPGLIEK